MTVSPEILTTLISLATLLAALAGSIGWVATRTDAKLDCLQQRTDAQFDRVDTEFGRIREDLADLSHRMNGLSADLNEVKISVARFEGPQLLLPREKR